MAEKTEDDILFQEIDDELRQDRAQQLWKAYGKYAITAVVVLVASVAGYQGWRNYDLSTRLAAGERFSAAMELAANEKIDEAFKAFADIATDGNKGYQLLARFSQARLLAQNGNSRDASLAYRVLADDVSIDTLYRELAVILSAYEDLNTPGTDIAALKERLLPLMAKPTPGGSAPKKLPAFCLGGLAIKPRRGNCFRPWPKTGIPLKGFAPGPWKCYPFWASDSRIWNLSQ